MAAAEAEESCCSEGLRRDATEESCGSDALTRDAAEESCGSDVVEMRPATGKNRPIVETVLLEPGETFVGTDRPKIVEDGEGPARRVRVGSARPGPEPGAARLGAPRSTCERPEPPPNRN